MRIRFFSLTVLLFSFISIFLLICQIPTPPPGVDEADVKLVLKTSTGVEGTTAITDTVGKFGHYRYKG